MVITSFARTVVMRLTVFITSFAGNLTGEARLTVVLLVLPGHLTGGTQDCLQPHLRVLLVDETATQHLLDDIQVVVLLVAKYTRHNAVDREPEISDRSRPLRNIKSVPA